MTETMTRNTRAQITRELAEQALAVVRAQFAAWPAASGGDGPKLYPPGFHDTVWTIAWEGGPLDWPLQAFAGDFDAEAYDRLRTDGVPITEAHRQATTNRFPPPPGVSVEALNHWSVSLYPTD